MKISPKQYAQSLLEAMDGQSVVEAKIIIDNFISTLVKNNHVSKTREILKYFEKIWNEKNKIAEAHIISAGKLSDSLINELKEFIIKKSQAKEIDLQLKEDKKILGGVIVRYKDKRLDLSVRNKLNSLKKELLT